MALAAGRVGVAPDQVDNNGHIIGGGGGGSVDAYTKSETNALLAEKADQSDLTANSKNFVFAYSNGQYGYKAGSTGAFTPFNHPGWNKPGALTDQGLVFPTEFNRVSGGYYYDTINNICYVDLVYLRTVSGSAQITGFPMAKTGINPIALAYRSSSDPTGREIGDPTDITGINYLSGGNDSTSLHFADGNGNRDYRHMIACYPVQFADNRDIPEEDNTRSLTEEEPIKEPTEEPSEEIKTTTKKTTRRKS